MAPPKLLTNVALGDSATGLQMSTICEPTVAGSSKRLFATGNWFASRSIDGGTTWTFVNPFTELPSVAGGFCCDQVVRYSKRHRRWIWYLQYDSTAAGENVMRIAISVTGAPGSWTWVDIAPTDLDPAWTGEWFDYPNIAETDGFLYISSNVYRDKAWRRCVVVRFPLRAVIAGAALEPEVWSSTQVGSVRLVQGAAAEMFFAGHGRLDRLELHSWPDDDPSVSHWSIPIRAWRDDRSSAYSSQGPGGQEWLARADGRITAGWADAASIGFGWTANSDATHPHPYIRIVRINPATMTVRDEPDLWSAVGAWAFPAASPNGRGRVGLASIFGGPTHPAFVVATLDTTSGASPSWSVATVATSTAGPVDGLFGDYVSVAAHPTLPTTWVAAGFTLQGGPGRLDVEPRVVLFR